MSGFNIEFNTSEFQASLEAYARNLIDGSKKGLQATGQEIRNQAIARTPVDTGALRSAWKVRYQETPTGAWVEITNKTPYAAAVEFGSREHTVTAKNKKVLADRRKGNVFGKTVTIPKQAPHPMLRPAMDRADETLIRNIERFT